MKRAALTAFALLLLVGCGSSNAASGLATTPTAGAAFESKCTAAAPDKNPLVVALPSADKLKMEARLRSGPLVVSYKNCNLELLSRCKMAGSYRYTGGTVKQDHVDAKNEDELFARIPLGAGALAGKLKTQGKISVAMATAGRFDADGAKPTLEGECTAATHWVSAITLGAYRMAAGTDAEVGAEASLNNAGAGGKSSSSRESLSEDGDGKACGASSDTDTKPPRACGALLRFELEPLGAAK